MIKKFNEYITEKKWSGEIETKFKPKEGTFARKDKESDGDMANRIANYLKRNSKDLKQAMSRLNFYINRGGKNVSKTDKKALEMAKDKLREKFGKKVNESQIDLEVESAISASDCYKELKGDFNQAISKFVSCLEDEVPQFDEGDTDHNMALEALILEATGYYGEGGW